ncbi:ABC transporter permease [Reyranella sp.]|jgi:peptide/nickel transport system permease protein|uniref:ABC transporter permease n=1 Tax=Reyranella sp. TaxID=1929291 RepID=UPI000BD47636|nr:ABC transporter permease [Reyranella sp.]OYY43808.1 MAG: NAD synthetase [Rhodospirillales bacterium 35-66-84]OYZ94636.1 MAG: NAD synthetase [Rhodospirillales bacterium 24-66-33]OZB25469.1 MAG: NAD synthetase [Rhodospirillales bacterium 39-66-50]HQS16627.1 ABC transporter permease [Reyranella sp.]HQT13625.1 ABC transporter permease [Reyranella sp.]
MTAATLQPTAWRRMLRHRLAWISLAFLGVMLVLAVAAPLIAELRGIDPTETDLFRRFEGPSARHWLGTDDLGRDLFQRLLDGGRVSLLVGISGAVLSAILGAFIGVLAGYLGGRLDAFLMRLTDGVISLPLLPLLIVLAAVDPRKLGVPAEIAQSEMFSLYRIVVIVALTGWTTVARLVRAETLSLKARDFTRAAVALGARPGRIMFRHILPNTAGTLVVATTMSVGTLILFESTLSFLGLGIQPPAASWGNMLTGAQELLQEAPVLALWPGLLIFLTVIAFNFLGDGLQDALDPRSERR